jgi:hypothetical protein
MSATEKKQQQKKRQLKAKQNLTLSQLASPAGVAGKQASVKLNY